VSPACTDKPARSEGSMSPVRRVERATNPVEEILALLGDAVLVPNRRLTKKPIVKDWQKLTLESMSRPDHIRSFIGQNIGVLLGRASGGLCTIDIDNDSDVEHFLEDNPSLRDMMRTKRVRGCNIWLRMEGDYPASTSIKIGGKAFGEWRADRNQTIIYGAAIDPRKGETEPTPYRFLNRAQPIRIRFDEIQWPQGCDAPTPTPLLRLHTSFCNTASLHLCITTELRRSLKASPRKVQPKRQSQKNTRNWFGYTGAAAE
jgi:hypothetical protein